MVRKTWPCPLAGLCSNVSNNSPLQKQTLRLKPRLPRAYEAGIGDLSTGVILGAIALSALVGWGALRALLLVTARGAFLWFAAYCALLGGLALALL